MNDNGLHGSGSSSAVTMTEDTRFTLPLKKVKNIRQYVFSGRTITNGKRTFASWMLMNSKAFHIRPARILSLSDSSEPFAVSFLTTFYSGMPATWRESLRTSKHITTITVHTVHSVVIPRLNFLEILHHDTSGRLKVLAMRRCNLNFHVLVQTIQYRHQSVNCKTPEICISDS